MNRRLFLTCLLSVTVAPLQAQQDWLEGWRDATVSIGILDTGRAINPVTHKPVINSRGDTVRVPYFKVIGTGVVTASPDTNIRVPILLTAKHVFYEPSKNWNPDTVRIRFSWFSDKSVSQHLGIKLPLKNSQKQRMWLAHPDDNVDLAIAPIVISIHEAGRNNISSVSIALFADTNDAFEGAPVLIFGYPGAVGPDYWTKPLLRHGVIAYVNRSKFGVAPFLVDAMVFPGNSGGPVFIIPSGMSRDGSFRIGGKPAFLGIVSSVARQRVDVEQSTYFEVSQKDSVASHYRSFDYMGLAVIEAAGRVKELLQLAK